MKNKNTFLKNILWTVLYAVFTLIVVLHHEVWADEAQVWMIVKDLGVIELFKHLVNEGHPSFFYLIIMPFAKLLHGAKAIMAMQIACWSAMVVSVFLLLQYSPFSRFTKFAIITSAGFLYFFPVIARSYSILPLLVFALAILYPKQKDHPLYYSAVLIMLANTHIIMFAFAFVLFSMFLFECFIKEKTFKKQYIVSCAIMLAGLAAVVLQLHSTTSSNVVIKIDTANLIVSSVKVISEFFINAYDAQYPDFQKIMLPSFGLFSILMSVLLYLTFFIMLFIKDKKLFSIAFFGILFQLAVYVIGYNHWIFVNRIFCAHLILLFCFWFLLQDRSLSQKFRKTLNIIIGIFFLLTFLNGAKYCILDLKYPYSGAKETAEFIEKNIDKNNSVIVTNNEPYAVSTVYYLDGKREILSAYKSKPIRYVVWSKELLHVLTDKGWSEYAKYMKEYNPEFKNKKIYVLIPFFDTEKIGVSDMENFRTVFISKPSIVRLEGYRLYEYMKH